MASFVLPRRLIEESNRDPERREWVATLPDVVSGLAERWTLRLGEPYQPGGACSWVAPAVDAAGRDLVLKVGWRHYEAEHEADGLRLWNGAGAVLLYDTHAYDTTIALLLERCVPGTQLNDALPEPEQDVVVAEILRNLWREPPDGHRFRPLQSMCNAWADEFEERLGAHPGAIDPGLARAGMELLRTLPSTSQRNVVLCTDLHNENILAAEREPWLAIDPKPYVGDPAYDVLQHMIDTRRITEDPAALVLRMAELAELDPERVRLWAFARCVQESIGMPQLRDAARRLAPR
ncbi:aminoglycoside phosphotransferase family protein [Phytoactinopolyspora endophytica]|uniref:aminoglycoside phosphotransferase family protein n=1 Tax=Phytoactinopolyspora endophytica TaxID=1642495 RepID=UPI00101CD267|nr:aminoglycoside phosphotransferase family protein [Phytoactinopolyspora endophytica]